MFVVGYDFGTIEIDGMRHYSKMFRPRCVYMFMSVPMRLNVRRTFVCKWICVSRPFFKLLINHWKQFKCLKCLIFTCKAFIMWSLHCILIIKIRLGRNRNTFCYSLYYAIKFSSLISHKIQRYQQVFIH